ncbi:MAG: sugar phosphate isomerase/epimerase [Candidatus Omnitrophica bacterium]|nr:sugar phosphate isomerase/epimerase [Candidatus Omnitrophota bacterium]MCM8807209.1 sugar phosphate isomerase/epimerase [Candidatus Omnitrophota bacterium]
MKKMKIGVIPDCFRLPIKEGIRKAAELGLDGIQPYATTGDLDPRNLSKTGREDLKHFVESLGLEISALVGDFGGHGFADPKTVEWRIERTKEVIDLAFDLGVKIVTTHIGVVPEDENDIAWKTMEESLPEVGTYAYNKGIVLATETGPEPATLLKKLLDKIGNPGLKVNYDPANLVMVAGDDPVKGVYTLANYIVHTHAKDGIKLPDENGKKRWKELPLGEGNVNWPEYLKAMKEIGYNGFFTIEREVGENPELDIIHARDFLRKLEREIWIK